MKESFVFYRSFYEAISDLDDKNQLQIYKAICEYALNFEKIELKGISNTVFKLIKPQIEANNKRFINGSKGGNPNFKKGQRNPYYPLEKDNLDNQKITNTLPNENDNVNVNDNYNVNINESESSAEITDVITPSFSHTATPTLSELRSYCSENNMGNFDYENFYNYYEANGWLNKNGTEIKNWKAKVNYWYKKDLESGKIKKVDTSRRLG